MKKYKKYIITFAALILFVSGIAIGIHMITTKSNTQDIPRQTSTKSDIPSIEITADGIRKHSNVWDDFVQASQSGKSSSIQLDYDYPGQIPHGDGISGAAPDDITLEFDGENYLCLEKKYKYLLELNGRMPNAAKNTTYVILSNEQYSFGDISKSIYSSNSNDHIPYMMLFTQ